MDREGFLKDFAEVISVDRAQLIAGFPLAEDVWDSMAVVSTIALIDEHYGKVVDGEKLIGSRSLDELLQLVEN